MTQLQSSLDAQGQRHINVGPAVAASDAVIKAQADAYARAPGVGTLRALRPAISWARDSTTTAIQHTAFPSVVQLRDGTLYMVVRRGSNHAAARDGGIWYSKSVDGGRTWSAPVQLWAAVSGLEYRDPCVSLSVDGTKIYLTYFKGSAALAAAGCFFRTSTDGGTTWSAEVRFDGKPYAACCAPVVELAGGRLLAPFYGRDNVADTWDSVYVAISTNGGTTWTPLKIYNGADVSTHLQEPWVSRKPNANDLFMTFRFGTNANIGQGTTAQIDGLGWSAATIAFAGTGRPSSCWLSTGELIVTYRDSSNQLMWARLHSGGWFPPTLVRRSPTGGFWTYAHPVETTPGVVLCPLTEEPAGAAISKLYTTTLSRGGGLTPLGVLPSDADAVTTGYDSTEYATTFRDRLPTTPLGPEWTVLAGAFSISSDGYLSSAAADNNPDRAIVDMNNADVRIDADFYMTVQSGVAVLTRVVDASNLLMFTVETSGTALRLYKIVAGTATQLTSATSVPVAFNAWNTFRVEATDTIIRGFVNGIFIAGYTLTAGAEANTFRSPGKHGLSLNAQSGGAHYCRRFVVFAR